MDSRIQLYKLSLEERRNKIKEAANLTDEEISVLSGKLSDKADKMIENVVGTFELPLGIATNFLINGKDYLIPMAVEEPSVVAAASHGAKIARVHGGFHTDSTDPLMIGQIQVINVENLDVAKFLVLKEKKNLIKIANECDPMLVKFGGGCKDIEVRILGDMLVVHLIINCCDAMGANVVNTMCEAVKHRIEEITKGKVLLRIVSNLAVYRITRAYAIFDKNELGGEEVVHNIIKAYNFAVSDIFRCATHNKGIMNGIDAVVIATGNDFRAVEAGAHSFAAVDGYSPLTKYSVDTDGNLVGYIEIPLAVGLIGGATKVHPQARVNLKILNVSTANELCGVIASLGLAQNLAALRALASEGIQKGHMKLHARNIAISAGIPDEYVDEVKDILIKEGKISMDYAKKVFDEIKERNKEKKE